MKEWLFESQSPSPFSIPIIICGLGMVRINSVDLNMLRFAAINFNTARSSLKKGRMRNGYGINCLTCVEFFSPPFQHTILVLAHWWLPFSSSIPFRKCDYIAYSHSTEVKLWPVMGICDTYIHVRARRLKFLTYVGNILTNLITQHKRKKYQNQIGQETNLLCVAMLHMVIFHL